MNLNRIYCLAVIFFPLIVVSQEDSKKLPGAMTPEIANLGKYGSYNVGYNTGTPNIGVPIYSLAENGMAIPITLNYDASGFIPNKKPGIAGLNWNLVAGGAITRIVNGQPDEKNNLNPNPSNLDDAWDHLNKGYIQGMINDNLGVYPSETIRSLANLDVSNQNFPVSGLAYEYQPDIFTFNFLGHSGKFFVGNDKTVHVVSDRRYKVDLTDFKGMYDFSDITAQYYTAGTINSVIVSRIKITSDDGYQFYFGGALPALEMSFNYVSATARNVDRYSGVINAWLITKVVTPDGNEINLKYKEYTPLEKKVIDNIAEENVSSQQNYDADFFDIKLYWNERLFLSNDPVLVSNSTLGVYYKTLTKVAYLQEITSKEQKIVFLYSKRDPNKCFYNETDKTLRLNVATNDKYFTKRLDKILVSDLSGHSPEMSVTMDGFTYYNASRVVEFNYEDKGSSSTGYRSFLKSIKINGPGLPPVEYAFDYYGLDTWVDPMTRNVDLWGFYNGQSNDHLIGSPTSDPEYKLNFSYVGIDRSAGTGSPLPASIGILKEIVYPTKGKTSFTYANHSYSKVLRRTMANGLTPQIINESGSAGGLRIKEISSAPGTTSKYFYINNYEQSTSNPSSGLLTTDGIYFLDYRYGPSLYYKLVSDNNLAPGASYNESHVAYSEVIEKNSDGFTKYVFSSHETHPDIYFLDSDSYKLPDPDNSSNSFNNQLLRLNKYSSRSEERGKLLQKKAYDNLNNLVYEEVNEYNTDPDRLNVRAIGYYRYLYMQKVWFCQSYANYYYHTNLSKQTVSTKDPASGLWISTVTTYKYKSNSNPLLTEKDILKSDKAHQILKYKYPEDFPSDPVYATMVGKFMVGNIIEEQILKNTDPLTTIRNNYYSTGTGLYKLQNTVQTNHLVPLSSFNPFEVMKIHAYDNNGKPLEASKGNDQHISYIWGYENTLPVAEVVNAKNNEVFFEGFEGTGTGWDGALQLDQNVLHSGRVAAKIVNASSSESYSYSNTILSVSLTENTKFRFSGWVFSGGPEVQIHLFIKAGSGSFTDGAVVSTGVTGKWVFLEKEFLVPSNITSLKIRVDNEGSGTAWFDDIRLHPSSAAMVTYTYNPFMGMTSKADMNNMYTYYEYDALGRLSIIRDQDKKVLKKYCYNYDGQVEVCAVDDTPKWIATGNVRCQPCPGNSHYFTNIQEHEEQDMNPNSSTANSVRWVSDGVSGNCASLPDWQNTTTAIRCKTISGLNTGEREQEQKDMNPCTNQGTRWVVVDQNCTACPKPANWQSSGNYRCVLDGSNKNTGYQEKQEIDQESCSPTYNQIRWVSVGVNCATCPKPANWQPTGNYRCVLDGNGNNTSQREQEMKDMESCSATYNQTQWVSVGNNCTTCPKPASWQPTGNLRCVKDGSNNNTGYQEREEKDMESCSATYNQLRWVAYAYNTTACPIPCLPTNCPGKCINGVCDSGTMKIISAIREKIDGIWYWRCTWVRCYSDGTYDVDNEELTQTSCLLQVSSCP